MYIYLLLNILEYNNNPYIIYVRDDPNLQPCLLFDHK